MSRPTKTEKSFSSLRSLGTVALLLLGTAFANLSVLGAPLVTRWAAEVTPTNVLPEYPRPQLVRERWQNLNGVWEYRVTADADLQPKQFEGRILVPFPLESYLSGVNRILDEHSTLWYRRRFRVPAAWRGNLVKLHFGAVDWLTKVSVNGHSIGMHRGGYDAFTFDITRALNWTGDNELVLAVMDPTEGDQARGKQSRKLEGIFYTASSGIWQTVWIEPVPANHIQAIRLVPDITGPALHATVLANTLADDLRAEVLVSFAGREMARVTALTGTETKIPLREGHFWSPAHPDLYDVTVILRRGSAELDRIQSYFGLREIRLGTDSAGVRCLYLNGQPLFEMGVLDQGFWPDGLYTAPSDAALRFDLETVKKLGFNLVRKHVKVEPERWYYWADKLGLLVWQDMPSGNNTADPSRRQFEMELERLIDQKANHPSIIMWILFNEGWGQFDTERLARRIKAIDPSRLVDSASGWTDLKVGDVIDLHSYPQPLAPVPEPTRASVLGEFGGLGLGISNHTWSARQPWGYQLLPDAEHLTDEYVDLLDKVWTLHQSNGLSAAVYTQLTDVETECNGFMTYDREVLKMELGRVRRANVHAPKLLPDARDGAFVWSYTTNSPPPVWMQPNYVVTGWQRGTGGFGTKGTPGAIINHEWKTSDIWLRREFVLPPGFPPPVLSMFHDEDAEVYINGVPAACAKHFITRYNDFCISPEAQKTLHPGTNLLAVHCHQSSGGQYIDVGLVPE